MNEGYSEAEALQITMEKFDEAELNEEFNDFIKALGGFDMEEYARQQAMYGKDDPVGLFYGGFVILGLTLGTFLGYWLGQDIIDILMGTGVGLFVGVSMGLVSHAIIGLKRK